MEERNFIILCVEDDPDDRLLTEDALREAGMDSNLNFAVDGADALDYLYRRGVYEGQNTPWPDLILLDLNLPKLDGREVLREIKSSTQLRRIPVVVLTTSKAEADIVCTYDLGVNSFITKPVTFRGLVDSLRTLGTYWQDTVQLPPPVVA